MPGSGRWSQSFNSSELIVVIKSNTESPLHSLLGHKTLQDIGGELDSPAIPGLGTDYLGGSLIVFKKLLWGNIQIDNNLFHCSLKFIQQLLA